MTLRPCVLIHGGWHGGWHWDEVADRLRTIGAVVHVPTLTGLGDRADEASAGTNLSTHIADVAAVLDRHDLHDVVLVAHSYGGMVATGVAAQRGERITELVYLDAFVPEDGQSVADLLGPDFVAAAEEAARTAGTPDLVPPMFTVEEITGWDPARAGALAARLSPHPIATMYEPVSAAPAPSARRTFIYCNARPLGLVEVHATRAREAADWQYFELASPHDAVHVMPGAVAGIVESLLAP